MIRDLFGWIKKHPLRIVVLLVYFLLGGTLVSILYFGFLNGTSTLLVYLLGTLGGLLAAGLWLWQYRTAQTGDKDRASRQARALVIIPAVLVAALAVYSFWQLYSLGQYPPIEKDYPANFERLWRAMDRSYPYFEVKGIDWRSLHDRYLPRVQAVGDDEAYYAVVSDLLAELNDGHTGLNLSNGDRRFAVAQEIEGQAVLVQVGPSATAAGLSRGDVILSVDDMSVDQAVANLPARLRSGPTEANRRRMAFSYLLRLPDDGQLEVEFVNAAGQPKVVTLAPSNTPPANPSASESSPVITARRLPSGVGVISIPRLWGNTDLVAEFDQALDGLWSAPGIILDLRGNGGGDSQVGDAIAGRFLSHKFIYGVEKFRQPISLRFWRTSGAYSAAPRGAVYSGPLVILTDAAVFSSAEMMVAALKDSGRATTVGQATGGGSGNPIRFHLLGGAKARFSTGAFYRNNGQLIEAQGIAPDVPVEETIEAFRSGRDLALETAEKLLLAP